MSLLRSISMSPLHKRRQRRSRLGGLCGDGGDGLELKEGDGGDGDEGKGRRSAFIDQKIQNIKTHNDKQNRQSIIIPSLSVASIL